MRVPIIAAVALLLAAGVPEMAAGQAADSGGVMGVSAGAAQDASPAAGRNDDQVISGLPPRAPEPRTMEAFWPVFAGFVVLWTGIIAYVLSFGRRWRRVESTLAGVRTGGPESLS